MPVQDLLSEYLVFDAYAYIALFVRIGAAFTLMPGFAAFIPTTQRVALGLALTLVVAPVLAPTLPPMPAHPIELMLFFIHETTIGVFLGMMPRFLIGAMDLAGNKISMGIGLANAQAFNPLSEDQSPLLVTFFALVAVTFLFMSDLHHLMILAVTNSYVVFPPGDPLPVGDWSEYLISILNQGFHLGFQLAAPFMVFSIVFYTGMGLIARLMPQLNIFFLSLPIKIYLGFALLMAVFPVIMMFFFRFFEEELMKFVA